MKLIIEIPEEVYEKQRYSQYFGAWSVVLQKCFENGTPQKTGHWIELGCVGNDNYDFECSECHHTDTHTKNVEVPYCWKCGAKMESEEKA